ncbi:MAG: hypothetical protein IJ681_02405 [Bacteroidales bacterium]|nr:hypothetical protein [Bacteroidales bacterium]
MNTMHDLPLDFFNRDILAVGTLRNFYNIYSIHKLFFMTTYRPDAGTINIVDKQEIIGNSVYNYIKHALDNNNYYILLQDDIENAKKYAEEHSNVYIIDQFWRASLRDFLQEKYDKLIILEDKKQLDL